MIIFLKWIRLLLSKRITIHIHTRANTSITARILAKIHFLQCICSRGVRKRESKMMTSCLFGAFKEDLATRAEFLTLVKA